LDWKTVGAPPAPFAGSYSKERDRDMDRRRDAPAEAAIGERRRARALVWVVGCETGGGAAARKEKSEQ